MDVFLSSLADWFNNLLDVAGSNPFQAMWILFLNGGWILLVWVFLWAAKYLWLDYVQGKFAATKQYIMLRITVPKLTEQTVKAAENMFAQFAGAHSSQSFVEKWIHGVTQSTLTVELVSHEGHVAYYVYGDRKYRDLIEASIYAQYPEAEIEEVEDYARNFPSHYPDEEWDLWGMEMVKVQKSDAFPLKTYFDFEDKVSGEFKDPMAAMLEVFSRLGPGEQGWFQIVLTPTDQKEFRERAEKLIKKLRGEKEVVKRTLVDELVDLPLAAGREVASVLLGSGGPHKEEKKPEVHKMMILSPGERAVLEAVERKASKIGFMCKIRFIYLAKKTVMSKSRMSQPFIGAIKQFNTFNMQAIKPDFKHTGVSGALLWFKDSRNNHRKSHLFHAYRSRSNWVGQHSFQLSVEELATLWHFPILTQVKAPQLRRTEAKRSEPPANVPFA